MYLNQATDYAFRAVYYLAGQTKGKVVEAQAIAQQESIPMRFLLKIMPSLIKAGIIGSQRGVGGGYFLAKDPGDITFFDVVEAIEGPVAINKCLMDPDFCNKNGASYCRVHLALTEIQAGLVNGLKKYNFRDIRL